jgi:hypothetical protein
MKVLVLAVLALVAAASAAGQVRPPGCGWALFCSDGAPRHALRVFDCW